MKRLDLHILYENLQFLLHSTLALQDEGKTHKHQQLWGIVNGLGGWQECVYVFLGFFHFGVKEHMNKISRETWDILFTCFFSGKLRLFLGEMGWKIGKTGRKEGERFKNIWDLENSAENGWKNRRKTAEICWKEKTLTKGNNAENGWKCGE